MGTETDLLRRINIFHGWTFLTFVIVNLCFGVFYGYYNSIHVTQIFPLFLTPWSINISRTTKQNHAKGVWIAPENTMRWRKFYNGFCSFGPHHHIFGNFICGKGVKCLEIHFYSLILLIYLPSSYLNCQSLNYQVLVDTDLSLEKRRNNFTNKWSVPCSK